MKESTHPKTAPPATNISIPSPTQTCPYMGSPSTLAFFSWTRQLHQLLISPYPVQPKLVHIQEVLPLRLSFLESQRW